VPHHDGADPEERNAALIHAHDAVDVRSRSAAQWFATGAEYRPHWAFIEPLRPKCRARTRRARKTHMITSLDQTLEREASPPRKADKDTLIYRVPSRMTGLPPTLGKFNAFLADASPDIVRDARRSCSASPDTRSTCAHWMTSSPLPRVRRSSTSPRRYLWPCADGVSDASRAICRFDGVRHAQLAHLMSHPTT